MNVLQLRPSGVPATARVIAVAMGALGLCASSASAHPHVSLTLPSSGDAGAAVPYSYSRSGLPASATLVLQRAQGTRQAWHTVKSLGRGGGSGQLAPLGLGKYAFRIAAIKRGVVLAQQARTLKVYGNVPFSELFNENGDVVSLPGGTFRYVMQYYDSGSFTAVTVGSGACRALHIDFVGATDSSNTPQGQTATLKVVQESLDPMESTSPANVVGALDVGVVPGQSWSIHMTQTDGATSFLLHWYLNGTASCYSSRQLRVS